MTGHRTEERQTGPSIAGISPVPLPGRVTGRSWRPRFGGGAAVALCWVVVGFLVVGQLLLMVLSSFRPDGLPSTPGLTIQNYVDVYADPQTYALLGNTVAFGVGSTLIAVALGGSAAFLVERSDMPTARLLGKLVLIPLAIPGLLLAVSWVLLLTPEIGVINAVAKQFGLPLAMSVYSFPGMIFVQGIQMVPLTYLLLLPSFRSMDSSLEEAALASGARPFEVVRYVVLPFVKPALMAVSTFGLIIGFVAFDVPGTLGIPHNIYTVGSIIYLDSDPAAGLPQYGQISALATSLLGILLALTWYYQRQTRHSQRFITVTGKATRNRRFRLGRCRYLAAGLIWLYVIVATIAPLLVLVMASFMPYFSRISLSSLTVSNYRQLARTPEALLGGIDTIIAAVCAATIVAILALLISWVVIRSRAPSTKALDAATVVPIAVPGIVAGAMLIFTFLTLRFIPVYGTVWIIVIGSVTISLPFATRTFGSALLHIDKELEEAGRVSGAATWATLRRITAPLAAPAIVVVWVWTVAFVMRELALPLMVQSGKNPMFATVLWGFWNAGQVNVAAAGGVVLIGVLVLSMTIWFLSEQQATRKGFMG